MNERYIAYIDSGNRDQVSNIIGYFKTFENAVRYCKEYYPNSQCLIKRIYWEV